MFISSKHTDGHYYLAKQSRLSQKYIWVKLPHEPIHNGIRVRAIEVPKSIRMKAYKLFEGDRKREKLIEATGDCVALGGREVQRPSPLSASPVSPTCLFP